MTRSAEESVLQETLTHKLVEEIQSYRNGNVKGVKQESKPSTGTTTTAVRGDAVQYELYYSPKEMEALKMSRYADLDARIKEMERILGKPSGVRDDDDDVHVQAASGDLLTNLAKITTRVENLDSARIDLLQRRVEVVVQKLDVLARKRATMGPTPASSSTGAVGITSEERERINKLFEAVERWDAVSLVRIHYIVIVIISKELPNIIQRLESLQGLHMASANLQNTISLLSDEQAKIDTSLRVQKKMLTDVRVNDDVYDVQLESQFAGNMTAISDNVALLDKRVKTIMDRTGV